MKTHHILLIIAFSPFFLFAQIKVGAYIPWTTYEAENMQTNGRILGPAYLPYHVETESSGQKCVLLSSTEQYVTFDALENANSMVIRYSLPDAAKGNGITSSLKILINNKVVGHYKISSQYCMLYGKYPFSNNPSYGSPRNFYSAIRIKALNINKGDHIKIQLDKVHHNTCIVDLVDLEEIAPPLSRPLNSLSLTDKRFGGNIDYTKALRNCIALAAKTGKIVWMPPGNYKITGDIVLPEGITIKGAGMWYTTLLGDSLQYNNENKRVRLIGNGSNIHLADFSIIGRLNYRDDKEANDGIVGSFGINSIIKNIWIEHTKVGMWLENSSHLLVEGCRLRNTIADGINFCVGMNQSIIKDCTARGTGDDCFAIWPTVSQPQDFYPEKNLVINCTAELPFLANGVAIYGGKSNKVENCVFKDISAGSAILISTTFPTEDKNTNNNFSGITTIKNCHINTSGGFDHEWGWRAAVEICLDQRNISGIHLQNLTIKNSLSNAISIISKSLSGKRLDLSATSFSHIKIMHYAIAVKHKYGLYISNLVKGNLTINQSEMQEIKNDAKYLSLEIAP